MSTPFLGEIRIVAFDYAPRGWAVCDGTLLPISQNTALFSLLGTTYGGNGTTTFALPDFRGRLAVGQGQGPGLDSYVLGQQAGEESHALTSNEMPAHNHQMAATSDSATGKDPHTGVYAKPLVNSRLQNLYQDGPANTLTDAPLAITGQNLPHENRQPYTALLYCIATQGIFPPRSRGI